MRQSTTRSSSGQIALVCLLVAACSTPPKTGPFADLPAPLTDSAATVKDAGEADLPRDGGPAPEDAGGEAVDAATPDAPRRDMIVVDAPLPPVNEACDDAFEVTVDSAATSYVVRGDTSYATDQFPTLSCGAAKADGSPLVFRGHQIYYLVTLPTGSWALRLETEGWTGLFYAAPWPAESVCGEDELNEACAHLWSTDRMVIGVDDSKRRWLIAVDSLALTQRGTFDLVFSRATAAPNSTCAAPAPLTLSDGVASVNGQTRGALDEFGGVSCAQPAPTAFRGGQLYYSVTLEQEKTYKLSLTTGVDLALYAFPAATSCDKAAIDGACAAHFNDKPGSGHETLLITTGASAEDYLLVVDSHAASSYGSFTLRVEEFVAAANSSCAQAEKLDLTSLPKTVKGDTTAIANEFPQLSCGLGAGVFDGGQLYYTLDLEGGKTYRVTVRNLTFDAGLYAFPASGGCDQSAVDTACAGHTGDGQPLVVDEFFGSEATVPETLYLSPANDETWIVAVDALGTGEAGTFLLEVDAYNVPANAACSGAEPVLFSEQSGKLYVRGDTSAPGLVDEFASVQCGGALPDAMQGPQLYYRFSLLAGGKYQLTLAPRGWDGALYLFPAATSCEAAAIDAACATANGVVLSSDRLGPNVNERLLLEPNTSGDWIVAVDSFSSASTLGSAAGRFNLVVEWTSPPPP